MTTMSPNQIEVFYTTREGALRTRLFRRTRGAETTLAIDPPVTLVRDPLAAAVGLGERAADLGFTDFMIVEFRDPRCSEHQPMTVSDGEGGQVTKCRRCAESLEEAS